ncbi:MAG: hypothetical protein BHW45_06265 [Roseburia sp. CAG:197_41_10]|nr:MAG: hypothetical protein BHW45_06265 [Roseburia sp. CAG:197_41_10]
MSNVTISDSIKYIGVDDTTLDLFESQYIVPNGVSYNSYVILDEKVAVMDTVDARKTDEWFSNLTNTLNGRTVDYIVISHLEPDHAANIQMLAEKYPQAKLVLSAKAKAMLPQFFDIADLDSRCKSRHDHGAEAVDQPLYHEDAEIHDGLLHAGHHRKVQDGGKVLFVPPAVLFFRAELRELFQGVQIL